MDQKKLPIYFWAEGLAPLRALFIRVLLFIFFFSLNPSSAREQQMHALTNLHQCFINIIFTICLSLFFACIWSLLLIRNETKSKTKPLQIQILLLPLFWRRNFNRSILRTPTQTMLLYKRSHFLFVLEFSYSGFHVIICREN